MYQLNIPDPCNEDWNKMSPATGGRHCNACTKTVVDFTAMPDEQVQRYLLNNLHEKTCGRFNSKQLQPVRIELPANIYQLQMPLWKKFLVACLLVFSSSLFSCDVIESKLGKVDQTSTGLIVIPITENPGMLMGDISICNDPVIGKPGHDSSMINANIDRFSQVKGEVKFVPSDTGTVPGINQITELKTDSLVTPATIMGAMKITTEQPDSIGCEKFS